MNGEMTERIALITGAARGIGLAVARALVDRGARVALVDVDSGTLVEAAGSLGSAALPITADVSRAEEVRAAVQTTVEHFGGLDILVNNAGICPMTPFEEIGEGEWDRVMAVNLKSAFLFSQAALPHVRRAGKRGRIVSIASIAGQMGGVSVAPHYSVSKAGLIALTKALAQRVAADGVTVNCVAPGTVLTDMTASWSDADMQRVATRIPLGRLGRPEEIAEAVCYLTSDSAAFITGATLDINGGIYLR